jgi:hypothetical protein
MCQKPLLDTNFYAFLVCIDEDLAAQMQARGCQRCGTPLHKNRYERRPRGGGLIVLGEGRHFHLSLSCSKCNKRHNPASDRFLSRRMYLAAIVVLASALHSGLTDQRIAQLTEWLGVPKRTIERWRAWWRQDFVDTTFWKTARATFVPPVAAAALPASVLYHFQTKLNRCWSLDHNHLERCWPQDSEYDPLKPSDSEGALGWSSAIEIK